MPGLLDFAGGPSSKCSSFSCEWGRFLRRVGLLLSDCAPVLVASPSCPSGTWNPLPQKLVWPMVQVGSSPVSSNFQERSLKIPEDLKVFKVPKVRMLRGIVWVRDFKAAAGRTAFGERFPCPVATD